MTPKTLNTVCALAALFADTFATAAAIFAVIVVPIFSPSTIAVAMSKGIHPAFTITSVKAIVALEDCRTIVSSVPISTKINTEPYPNPAQCCRNESTSGDWFRSGTEFFRKLSPRNSRAKPIMNSPILLFLLFFATKKTKPTAISGIEREAMSTVKPRMEISQAVTVVPMFAPIITPMAFARDSRPAFTKLTTITVVALEDCMTAVIPSPVRTCFRGVDVIEARNDLNLSPAAFWSPSLIRVIP